MNHVRNYLKVHAVKKMQFKRTKCAGQLAHLKMYYLAHFKLLPMYISLLIYLCRNIPRTTVFQCYCKEFYSLTNSMTFASTSSVHSSAAFFPASLALFLLTFFFLDGEPPLISSLGTLFTSFRYHFGDTLLCTHTVAATKSVR